MTSTSFNIGLGGSEKNSSRVLRPPGGGHSDIFGVRDNENGLVTPSKKRIQHQSSISSCFMDQTKGKETLPLPIENKEITNGEEIQNGEVTNGIDHEIDENKAPSEPEEKKEPNQCAKRVRVPPGGFSSGLW